MRYFYKFGSIAWVTERKNEFLIISFKKDKKIAYFADRFYLKAQILMGLGLLIVHDTHIALRAAMKPYKALYRTLMPAFQDNCTLDDMISYLRQCGNMFGPPSVRTKPRSATNFQGRSEVALSTNKFVPKNDITKVVCHCCNWKGHYTSNCNSKTGIHMLPPLEFDLQGKVNLE
ncbi:hypothetical protein DSO57_1005277 [Entomophthora muscae]|uniref:Uncharacterized protein n=1 Tax=Entomophthora muscae TaxID=34485 RepID=A0ACC2TJ44_9FUNG|nr:hypothetical protein DSO57_1005277 [Entomophthora muscae]